VACVPKKRVQVCNDAPVNPSGDFVLYWMTAFRRTHWNFALQRAIHWAGDLGKPLVILEALRCGYKWASDRFHSFIIDGMRDNAERLAKTNIVYYPYLEPKLGDAKGLLETVSTRACLVVTDNFPEFFLPRMVSTAATKITVRLEQVDSNGLLPLSETDRVFTTAHSFRRFLQKNLGQHLREFPEADPLFPPRLSGRAKLPEAVVMRWPAVKREMLNNAGQLLWSIPVDHAVKPSWVRGGSKEASRLLDTFLTEKLSSYSKRRNHPDDDAASGLSPHLHFGHISVHQVFYALMTREGWMESHLSSHAAGSRQGWWGVRETAEAFLDELITWRELGYNMCWNRSDYDQYESLPDWARKTLSDHACDVRTHVYAGEEFESARTHDPLWNAAQIQLVREGRLHNYLRMLWGKKILEWSPSPKEALDIMIHLNNTYGLDGRDPNSYSGIFWVLGRYDRPWAPERPIYGKVRYMSSANTARKVRVREYMRKYST
jgi:deoxyribodipyrimidine photo-lyase